MGAREWGRALGLPDPELDPQFYAGVPFRRLTAFVLDTIIIAVLWFVVLVIAMLASVISAGLSMVLGFLMLTATGLVYRWLMLSQRSATVGMMVLGIEVRGAKGERCTDGPAFLHSLLFLISLWFLPMAIVGWILMATSPRRQAIHDLILGTVVINRPK